MPSVFWKPCNACKTSGEVPPQSPHAQNPAQMSGEIRDLKTSVCRHCHGTGIKWSKTA